MACYHDSVRSGFWIFRLKSMCCTDWCTALVLNMSISVGTAVIIDKPTCEGAMEAKLWLTVYGTFMQVGLRDVPATLEEELALPTPLLPESPRNPDELCAFDIIEHDDVRTRVDRLVRLRLGADLDLKEKAESANFARLLDSVRDRAYS